ncbi:unnamed protein product, partial [Mycena citricolor]
THPSDPPRILVSSGTCRKRLRWYMNATYDNKWGGTVYASGGPRLPCILDTDRRPTNLAAR